MATMILNTMVPTESYHESFFYVDSFEEFMGILPIPEDMACQFCKNFNSLDYANFKRHMMQAHFRHSCIVEYEGKPG